MDDSIKTLVEDSLKLVRAAQEGQTELEAEFTAKGEAIPDDRQAAVDQMLADAQKKKDQADKAKKGHDRQRAAEETLEWAERLMKSAGRPPVGGPGMASPEAQKGGSTPSVAYKGRDGQRKTYEPVGLGEHWSPEQEAQYTEDFRSYVAKGRWSPEGQGRAETRKGLLSGLDTSGGLWVMPEIVETQLIQEIADQTVMRRLATVRSFRQMVSIRALTASRLDDAEWTAELTLANADTAEPAGARRLTPHPLSKLVYLSEDEVAMSIIDSEGFVTTEMARVMGETEENAFMTGDGSSKAQGLFVSNLPVVRRAAGDASPQTEVHPLDFVDVAYDLKSGYRPGASWIMHRETERRVAKFRDTTGQFMWRPGVSAGQPNTLQGYPINTSEFAPSTFAADQPVAALGQWKRAYRIVEVKGSQLRRLDEIASLSNQIVFKGRRHVDGMVVDGNAVVVLKMAAA